MHHSALELFIRLKKSLCIHSRKRFRHTRHLAAMYDTTSTVVYIFFSLRILCTSLSCTTRELGTRELRALLVRAAHVANA